MNRNFNFVNWMANVVHSIHYADKAAMDRAISNLSKDDE
jgi:hypothetical protein